MKLATTVLAFIMLLESLCVGQDGTAKYRFQASRGIPAGTILHYLKTNIDGTHPEHVSQYFASADSMESFKFHPGESPAGYVIAVMDWKSFSTKSLASWQVFSRDDRKLFGTIDFDSATRRGKVSIPRIRNESEVFAFEQLPVHLYNFDLGTLNFAFPYLIKPKGSFVIGIADPTFAENGPLVEYKGAVTISYVTEEKRDGVQTRKYNINGPGLKQRGGLIWVDKKHGWIQDMEIDLPDNPDWSNFKLKLMRSERMDRAAWERFMTSQF